MYMHHELECVAHRYECCHTLHTVMNCGGKIHMNVHMSIHMDILTPYILIRTRGAPRARICCTQV